MRVLASSSFTKMHLILLYVNYIYQYSMVHVADAVETSLPYTAAHIDAFLQNYLQHSLPRKLLSETTAEMEKQNAHSLGGYVENIAGCQFQDRLAGGFLNS